MSALTEALEAARSKAVAALEKAYVAGAFEDDKMREQLDSIGCTDAVDQDYLIRAEKRQTEKPTEAQKGYIGKLCAERNIEPPAGRRHKGAGFGDHRLIAERNLRRLENGRCPSSVRL